MNSTAVRIAFLVGLGCAVAMFGGSSATRAVAAVQDGSGSPVTVTEQDAGTPVEMVKGQMLLVRLESNPTTGYQWMVGGNPAPVEFVRSDFAADPHSKNPVGAGGTQTLQLVAKATGTAQLKLEYRRPWEKNVAPARTVTFSVVVK